MQALAIKIIKGTIHLPGPVEDSYPVQIDITDGYGVSRTQVHSYDALKRVVQITNFNGDNTLNLFYLGMDTVITEDLDPDGKKRIDQRKFNSIGDHTTTLISVLDNNGDTTGGSEFLYTYNINRQIDSAVWTIKFYSNGKLTSSTIQSSNYQWVEGNVTKISPGAAQIYGDFEYLQNTNGFFMYNSPLASSYFMYYTTNKPLLSKNLVSKITDANGVVADYSYEFGDFGRVKSLKINSDNKAYAFSYKFTYKCK